jgi:hypothetical protein
MQTETLMRIKQQIVLLDKDSKRNLAAFLAEELKSSNNLPSLPISDEESLNQIEWLKQNREKYAGKYVALHGNELSVKASLCAKPANAPNKRDLKTLLRLLFTRKMTFRSEAGNV